MKKIWFILSLVVFLFGVSACEKSPIETGNGKGGNVVLGGDEKYTLVGEWYEANSTDIWGVKAIFTESTMSIISYGFTKDNIWKDTFSTFADNLGYKIIGDDTLEFEYRPPTSTEIPNYKVYYTFKSPDTLFIEKIWANNPYSCYPPILEDILLCKKLGTK